MGKRRTIVAKEYFRSGFFFECCSLGMASTMLAYRRATTSK
jgi:hypothetical protein